MAVRPDHRDQLNSLDQHRQLISKLPSVQSCHCYTLVSLDHHNTIKNSSNLPVMQLQLTQHHSKRFFYFSRRSPRFVEKNLRRRKRRLIKQNPKRHLFSRSLFCDSNEIRIQLLACLLHHPACALGPKAH